MRSPLHLLLPLATSALLACGGAASTTMEPTANDFATHVAELEGEFNAHATKAAAAPDVTGIATLDGTHRTMSLEVLTKLDGMLTHLSMCTNASHAKPDMMVCHDAMAKLRTAAEAHSAKMATMANLTDARAEEERHHMEMGTELAAMMTHAAAVKKTAASYTCDGSMGGH